MSQWGVFTFAHAPSCFHLSGQMDNDQAGGEEWNLTPTCVQVTLYSAGSIKMDEKEQVLKFISLVSSAYILSQYLPDPTVEFICEPHGTLLRGIPPDS